jgi:hypothetical protein
MPTIQEVRSQYPQYSDMSDDQLAGALHQKYYSDMPEDQFRAKIGMKAPEEKKEKPGMSDLESAGQTALGAGKEIGKQAVETAQTFSPASQIIRTGQAVLGAVEHPKETKEAVISAAKGVKEAVTHPIDTAQGALTDWMEKAHLPVEGVDTSPKTPAQAQERGAAIVQGAEAVIPGGGAVRDVAKVAALPFEKALAPLAEKVAARGEAKVAEKVAAGQEKSDLIKDVRKLGLRLTSQDVGAPIGKRVEALASRPQLEREISQGNAARVKEAAAKDVGIKGPLSKGAVNTGIKEALVPYKAPRTLGRVDLAADAKWQQDLKSIAETSSQEHLDFPEDVAPQIDKEIEKFNKPSADADSIVSKIAKLRERASDNFSGNADDKALARAQRKIATAMEEAIERHGEAIGQGSVIKSFREARTRLAKLYTIRDALTETGELDLGVLEKELQKGEPLTGNLRTLARAKASFDRSFQNPENIRGHPVGALDIGLGVLAGGGKGAAAGGIAGMGAGALAAGARPAARAILGSKPYQAMAIKPRVPKVGVVTREARKIADKGKKRKPQVRDIPDQEQEKSRLSDAQ